jgi:penicillin amidase
MKKASIILILVLLTVSAVFVFQLDRYKKDGTVVVNGLSKPVTIHRDEAGIPYIFAESIDDAFFAQGWIVAQDRLFQLEVVRLIAQGRLAEVAGESVLKQDKIIRALDLRSIAKKNGNNLDKAMRAHMAAYANGINAYIAGMGDEFPATLKLNGIDNVQPWSVDDLLTATAFSDWITGGAYEPKILRSLLQEKLGKNKAAFIDAPVLRPATTQSKEAQKMSLGILNSIKTLQSFNIDPYAVGSNTWVVDGGKTSSGKPLLANDPHLDPRLLPGIWYPVAIFTPQWKIAGATGATLPGVAFGRNQFVAWGITNSYGDVLDLYEEKLDENNPANYLDNAQSVPFKTRSEIFRIRNPQNGSVTEQKITIRFTARGPILNDLGLIDSQTSAKETLISLRTAIAEFPAQGLGNVELNFARNLSEARAAIGNISAPINFSIADREGNIGIQSSGFIPLRTNPESSAVISPAEKNIWAGKIAPEELPNIINPENGFAIAANQYLPDENYPYYFSAYGAHTFRYERIRELLNNRDKLGVQDMFEIQQDVFNKFAESVTPILINALQKNGSEKDAYRKLAQKLDEWNYQDQASEVGPTIFQSLIRHLFKRTYSDELGSELSKKYLAHPYLWQNSLQTALLSTSSEDFSYFDNLDTPEKETKTDIINMAAADTVAELTDLFQSSDMEAWQWGKVHQIIFKGPALPLEAVASVLGRSSQPFDGSGETVRRAKYSYDKPYSATVIQSALMVVDMGVDDKFILNIPGGNSGRQFSRDLTAMLDDFLQKKPSYIFFDKQSIEGKSKHRLSLIPNQPAM